MPMPDSSTRTDREFVALFEPPNPRAPVDPGYVCSISNRATSAAFDVMVRAYRAGPKPEIEARFAAREAELASLRNALAQERATQGQHLAALRNLVEDPAKALTELRQKVEAKRTRRRAPKPCDGRPSPGAEAKAEP
jgi:hypothetical protein